MRPETPTAARAPSSSKRGRRSIATLTAGLLGGSMLAILVIAAGFMSYFTLAPGSRHMAEQLVALVSSQQALRAAGKPVPKDVALMGIRVSNSAPITQTPRSPLGAAVQTEISRLQPRWEVRLDERGPDTLYVRFDEGLWLVIPFRPLASPVLQASMWILLLATGIVVVTSLTLARRLVRPLQDLVARADALIDGRLDPAVFAHAPAEVASLASRLNELAARQQQQRRDRDAWLAGLSHDLRTPLARLRFALELKANRGMSEQAHMVADIEEMDVLIGHFIALIREGREEQPSELDLCELVIAVADSFARQAEIDVRTPIGDAPFHGRVLSIKRGLGNLVRNAIEHGSAPIRIELQRHVADGPLPRGFWRISVENAPRPGGDRGPAGFGIGLSVVRMVAEAHGGDFRLDTRSDGSVLAEIDLPGDFDEAITQRHDVADDSVRRGG